MPLRKSSQPDQYSAFTKHAHSPYPATMLLLYGVLSHTHSDSPNTSPRSQNTTTAWPSPPLKHRQHNGIPSSPSSTHHMSPQFQQYWLPAPPFPSLPHSAPGCSGKALSCCRSEHAINPHQPVLPTQGKCTAPSPKGCPGGQSPAPWCACSPPPLEARLLLTCPRFRTR
jgi:hypothetical protein